MTEKDELKLLKSRADDAILIAENKYTVKSVGFLTPAERVVLQKNCAKPHGGKVLYFGGYEEAERTLFVALPEYFEDEDAKDEIALLVATGRNITEMSHRDFLGSLMGLGIKREMVGDILLFEDKCLIFVKREIADYIIGNLEKIGRNGIKIEKAELGDFEIPPKRTEEIGGTVAGVRLDCVLSVALKTSRSKTVEYIASGKVTVNWEETENVSKMLSEGDILSVKGKGRYKLSKIGDLTKKGRYSIVVERYI